MRPPATTDRWRWALELALVWAVFVLHTGFLIPEVNEPNYLAKAKHFWNPAWCSQDFFLQTADAHTVFYWSFGWLTLLMPLPAVALVGRLATCALLAYGWQQLSRRFVTKFGFAVLSAALLVTLNRQFHMAGEWIVQGVEGKGFAYAFVFLGLAALVNNQWNRVWILLGIATAFHVLVGGWSIVVAAFAWCCLRGDADRASFRSQLPGLAVGALIALLGVWPAWQLSVDAGSEVVDQATRIQVFQRLPHHLNPWRFFFRGEPPYLSWFAIRFSILIAVWLILVRTATRSATGQRLAAFATGTLVIAAIGLIVSLAADRQPSLTAALLRFYWFRLADVLIPAAVALTVASRVAGHQARQSRWTTGALGLAAALVILDLVLVCSGRISYPVPRADRMLATTQEKWEQWRALCEYVRNETPDDAIFLTPNRSHTFKWYANRGEVVTWKEMPQDAASVVAWWNRIEQIHGMGRARWRPLTQRSPQELLGTGKKYGADYLVTRASPPIDLPRVYQNNSFVIYRLHPKFVDAEKP